jgi:hypothetical protein
MSSAGAASLAALSPARVAASRKNGARSRGPKTPAGKARSAQNALKHGLRAQKYLVLPEEDAAAFAALEAALLAELAPEGALQAVLARRIVAAAWRLERAERLEAELFEKHGAPVLGYHGLGIALIRDGKGPRAFDTLLRYRGGTLAEFWRALRTLQAPRRRGRRPPSPRGPSAASRARGRSNPNAAPILAMARLCRRRAKRHPRPCQPRPAPRRGARRLAVRRPPRARSNRNPAQTLAN